MEQEIQKLGDTIQDLTRRVERHEWRIVDLEKRLMLYMHQADNHAEHIVVDQEADYKEPILKRAASSSAGATVKNTADTYIGWLVGTLVVGGLLAWLLMQYL